MRLSQENASKFKKKDVRGNGVSSNPDKLKASNFPASLLKIGSWEVYYSLDSVLTLIDCVMYLLFFNLSKLRWFSWIVV